MLRCLLVTRVEVSNMICVDVLENDDILLTEHEVHWA